MHNKLQIKRLLNTIQDNISKNLDEHLFEFEDTKALETFIQLNPVINSCKTLVTTWESLYPDITERAYAMDMYKKYGDTIYGEQAESLNKNIYEKSIVTTLLTAKIPKDELEYLDILYESEKRTFISGEYSGNNHSAVDTVNVSYRMKTPYNTFNLLIKPSKPIEHIELTATITKPPSIL